MLWEVDVWLRDAAGDHAAREVTAGAAALGIPACGRARTAAGWLIEGDLSRDEAEQLATTLFADPVTESAVVDEIGAARLTQPLDGLPTVVHVLPKAGVTDPAGLTAQAAAAALGHRVVVRSLRKYWLPPLDAADISRLAEKLLANDAIQDVVVGPLAISSLSGGRTWSFAQETIPLAGLDDAALEKLSRERCLALSVRELHAVRDHFVAIGRDPFEIELETIAQTWSEHCCHKTKVETHNHPSAIEPYGGAATGLGGVIRDVLGTGLGAKPIANLDVFCVAPPDTPADEIPPGVIHPQRLLAGVAAGVRDYGNRMGIPTIAGAVAFHPGYIGNPLVFCGTVGIMPRGHADAAVQPGDLVVVAGGRTGRDGIHGATFSSIELTSESETESGGAVQIGHAINEKMLTDFVLEASRQQLFHAITDCGAGGLSSAVGEMGATLGADVDLDRVPLKYEGLSATEAWISEAQERMVLAVGPADWPAIAKIADDEGVEATPIGTFTGSGRIVLKWQGRVAGELDCHFLHEGRPRQRLVSRSVPVPQEPLAWSGVASVAAAVVEVLALPDVASKERIVRQYDHEVQGCSVLKPLLGPGEGPADGTVIRGVLGRDRGIVLGVGLRHHIGRLDPYQMAAGGIAEAIANAVAAGADPDRIALLDNFCWGDTRRTESLGTLVEACRACHDLAIALAAPFVSGKDSLNNVFTYTDAAGTAREISIPPTLLITAMGQLDDVRRAVSPDLKAAGNRLAVVGETRADMAGSQLALTGRVSGGDVPTVDVAAFRAAIRAVSAARRGGFMQSCHDVSDGGLAAAVAEMAIAGKLGARIALADVPATTGAADHDLAIAFAETPGRFVCEVRPEHAAAFARCMDGIRWSWIGEVAATPELEIVSTTGTINRVAVDRLAQAWHGENV